MPQQREISQHPPLPEPVVPGSHLHRLLQLVAQAVAKRLAARGSTGEAFKEDEKTQCPS
jgi:hypothetical protein